MRLYDHKIFQDREKLAEMLDLRLGGYSISALATLFKCDKSSIRYQCDKYNVEPPYKEVYAVERIASQVTSSAIGNWKIINGERVNMGKSYKEYLQEVGFKYPPKIAY